MLKQTHWLQKRQQKGLFYNVYIFFDNSILSTGVLNVISKERERENKKVGVLMGVYRAITMICQDLK